MPPEQLGSLDDAPQRKQAGSQALGAQFGFDFSGGLLAAAFLSRQRWPMLGAAVAGLALGWAFNCKQPCGIFVLPVLACLAWLSSASPSGWASQWRASTRVKAG